MELVGPPRQLTRFIGRTRELSRALELIERSRLVTLLGSPGTGKTRLAIEVANLLSADHNVALAFVDLTQTMVGLGVADVIATAIGLSPLPGDVAARAIERHLRANRVVLVLDNCEHVREEVADLVEILLASCPGVRFLATSREPLALPGESRQRIRALGMPGVAGSPDDARSGEAVQLFVDRTQLVDPGFELTDETASRVSEICRRLDGNPLAIELAASLTGALSLADIQAGLRDRFRLLYSRRNARGRQRSLQAAIEWSEALLSPDERRAFQRLSVFQADFSAESARTVLAGEDQAGEQVIDLLARLCEKSLVERADGVTSSYRMLESLRDFAWLRLTEQPDAVLVLKRAAEEAASRQALRTAVYLFEEALRLPRISTFERLHLLAELARQAEMCGLYKVGVSALEELRAMGTDQPVDWQGRLMVRMSNLLVMATADLTAAEDAAATAADLFGQAADRTAALSAATQLAWLRGLRGDLPAQEVSAAEVVKEARAAGDWEALMHAVGCLGTAQAFRGGLSEARSTLQQALELSKSHRATDAELWATAQLAFVRALDGDVSGALALLPGTLTDESVEPVALEVLVFARYLAGDFRAVLELVNAGATALGELGVRGGWVLATAAACAAERGESALAEELAERAGTLFADRPVYAHFHAHLWMLGVASWCRRDFTEAIQCLMRANEGLLAMDCRPLAALSMYDLCGVYDDGGLADEAAQVRARLRDVAAGLPGPLFAALIAEPEEAARTFARLDLRVLHARALVQAGQLEQAARGYEGVGCIGRCERALAMLGAGGQAPPSPAARGLAKALVFGDLSLARLEELAGRSEIAHYRTGDPIARRNAPIGTIYVVEAGRAKAVVGTSSGEELSAMLGPGDLVGERGLVDGARYALDVVAVEECRLIGLRRDDLLKLLVDEPIVGERLMLLLRQRIRADARITGDPEPADLPGEVIRSVQQLSGRPSRMAPSLEILPVYLISGQIYLLRPQGQASWKAEPNLATPPGPFVDGQLAQRGIQSVVVHSTSWRYEQARLVLSYLAIMSEAVLIPADFDVVPVRRAELARGSAKDAPDSIDVAQVVEHGLRHLSWLSRDDPVIARELSAEWKDVVATYIPEPFRAL